MDRYARSHLADQTLLRSAETNAGRERTAMADLLADIAEIDVRKLYLPAAYPSLHAYGVGPLRLSEDAAFKRIHAARTARRFPVIFVALAEGRLNLSGVCLLAARLTQETAAELLAAAMDQSNSQIERLLAARFPQSDVLPWVVALAPPAVASAGTDEHAARHVEDPAAPGPPPAQPHMYPRVKPLSAQSFGVQFTLSRSEHDLVQYAQELLPGDVREVFLRALRAHVRVLEQGKFAATEKPRSACRRPTRDTRHIPAHLKRAVWTRDGGQCTFVSDTGHRCQARKYIQFDHIVEVARGGEASVSGIRLLCRAHNQHAAERTFGAEFMRHKRIAADEARAAAKARTAAACAGAAPAEPAPARAAADAEDRDVVPWLRQLGFSVAEARRAAARCEDIPDASLEERVRVALSCIGIRGTRVGRDRQGPEAAALAGGAPVQTQPIRAR